MFSKKIQIYQNTAKRDNWAQNELMKSNSRQVNFIISKDQVC